VLQQYEQVRGQIDSISNRLDGHTSALMKDIRHARSAVRKTLAYFHSLATYIAAGEEWLRRLDAEQLPALQKQAEASADVLKAQAVRDLRAKRDDLERRVHDLKLTRQVTMQSLPSIRLVQENDKALVGKIGSTMANTIPLWRQQLRDGVTIARSAEAGDTLKQATDLTNELLTANADTLRTSTQAIRTQIERGVVDIAAVKQANDALIATIDDALRIADDGKRSARAREDADRVRSGVETGAGCGEVARPPTGTLRTAFERSTRCRSYSKRQHAPCDRAYSTARWDGYQPRNDDIIIATYSKCGTTWMQRIVGMLLFQSAAPTSIWDLSPWPDMRLFGPIEAELAKAEAQSHRRFFKTHLPLDACRSMRASR
jgi:hypothetical protein